MTSIKNQRFLKVPNWDSQEEEIIEKVERSEIVNEIKSIFKEVFPELNQLNLEQNQDQFENWDSFSHLELVSKVEEKFRINLEIEEVIELDTPLKFVEIVEGKINF